MTAQLDPATIAAWWHRQAERDGLPDKLTTAELAKVVTLALAGTDRPDCRRRPGQARTS